MTLNEAYRILRRHQDWRRGYDCRTIDQVEISSKLLGQAIDVIMGEAGMKTPLTCCRSCKHRGGNIDIGDFCRVGSKGECSQYQRYRGNDK